MFKVRKFKLILLLVGVTFFAYLSSLGNPFIWDDEQFITSNLYVQNFDLGKIFTTNTVAGAGVVSNYYRPLTTLSFAIDTKIWGSNSFGFHLTNLFFHTGAGILLFLLILEVGLGEWGAFFISLFFLIHPVQTEAVTYINSRGDSMFTFFLFGSLVLFQRALSFWGGENRRLQNQSKEHGQDERRFWMRYVYQNDVVLSIGAILLYILSILSKETAIAAFPLFFVLVFMKILKDKKPISQSMRLYAKGIIVALFSACVVGIYFFLRLIMLNFSNVLNYYTAQTEYSTHFLIRLFTFARVLWIYLGILVWPYPLHMERSVGLVYSFFSWEVWGILLLIVGILSLVIWEIKKQQTGIILFGFALSACLLIPVSGIIPINGILYEHWLYIPMIGFWVMGYGIWRLMSSMSFLRKQESSRYSSLVMPWIPDPFVQTHGKQVRDDSGRKILISFGIVLSILYIILTIRQNNIWSDPVTFYKYTLSFAPNSARVHNNLGTTFANKGDLQNALIEYQQAVILGGNYPQAYYNLGLTQLKLGDYENAEKNLKKALRLSSRFELAKVNLLKLYIVTKQTNKAQEVAKGDPYLTQLYSEFMQLEKKQ